MLDQLLLPLQRSAAQAARRAIFGSAGGILVSVGIVFLSIAAWIYLEQELGALLAAVVMGLAFVGVGLIVIAWGMRAPRYKRHIVHDRKVVRGADAGTLIAAFVGGLTTGSNIRRR